MSDRMLRQFDQRPLTPSEAVEIKDVRDKFSNLAHWLVATVEGGPERTAALRKLLEAKDCAVRAIIFPVQLEAYVKVDDVETIKPSGEVVKF